MPIEMTPTYDVTRSRGDTYKVTFALKDSLTGAAIDVSGCTFTLSVSTERAPAAANYVFQSSGAIVGAGTDGVVEFPFTDGNADNVGNFFYDVQMTDGAAKKRTVVKGRWTVLQDITK